MVVAVGDLHDASVDQLEHRHSPAGQTPNLVRNYQTFLTVLIIGLSIFCFREYLLFFNRIGNIE